MDNNNALPNFTVDNTNTRATASLWIENERGEQVPYSPELLTRYAPLAR